MLRLGLPFSITQIKTQKIKGASRIETVIMSYTILKDAVMRKLKSLLELELFRNS